MRPILPPWAMLLVAAIAAMAAMFWIRANPPEREDPLEEAAARLSRGLGFEVEPVPTPGPRGGLLIKAVLPGSPAQRLGLVPGERIVAVSDRSVWHALQLEQLIGEGMSKGGPFQIMLSKDDTYRTVSLGRFAPPPPVQLPDQAEGQPSTP